MATAIVRSDSCDGAGANHARLRPPPAKANAADRRAIDAGGYRGLVYEPRRDLLPDWPHLAPPQSLDQARLGEEPQPMLPGLEGC